MFYKFFQNNSGGFFLEDDNLARIVIIEAESDVCANLIAKTKGLYFYGVQKGIDCNCCGDRWYEAWSEDVILLEELTQNYNIMSNGCQPSIIIHYLNGNVEKFYEC